MPEAHISQHPAMYPQMPQLEGKVTAIYAKDHEENLTAAFTLYQVEVYPRYPADTQTLGPIRVAGQEFGGTCSQTDTLEINTPVMVGFTGGDPNKAVILHRMPDFSNTIAPATADLPISQIERRGAKALVDKDGNATITVAEDKNLRIVDSDGNELFELEAVVGGYEMKLMDGAMALLMENFFTAYSAHTHTAPSGATGPPLPTLVKSTYVTAKVFAK